MRQLRGAEFVADTLAAESAAGSTRTSTPRTRPWSPRRISAAIRQGAACLSSSTACRSSSTARSVGRSRAPIPILEGEGEIVEWLWHGERHHRSEGARGRRLGWKRIGEGRRILGDARARAAGSARADPQCRSTSSRRPMSRDAQSAHSAGHPSSAKCGTWCASSMTCSRSRGSRSGRSRLRPESVSLAAASSPTRLEAAGPADRG